MLNILLLCFFCGHSVLKLITDRQEASRDLSATAELLKSRLYHSLE